MSSDTMPVFMDLFSVIEDLTDEETGFIFRAMGDYWREGLLPEIKDRTVKACWNCAKNKLDLARRGNEKNSEQQRLRAIIKNRPEGTPERQIAQELSALFSSYPGTVSDFRKDHEEEYRSIGLLPTESHGMPRHATECLNITEQNRTERNITEIKRTEGKQEKYILGERNRKGEYERETGREEPMENQIFKPEDIHPHKKELESDGIDIRSFSGWLFNNEEGQKHIGESLDKIIPKYLDYKDAHAYKGHR